MRSSASDSEGDKPKRGKGSAPQLKAAAKLKRDARICTMRAARKPWAEIAGEVGVTTRQCQSVWKQYLTDRENGLVEQGPDNIVAEAIEELEMLANRMARTAEAHQDNPSVLIGATRAQEKILMDKIDLMQSTGLLPHDLGTIRHLHDVRALIVEVVEIMRRRKVPLPVIREIERVVAA